MPFSDQQACISREQPVKAICSSAAGPGRGNSPIMHWLEQTSTTAPAQSRGAAALFEDDSALILRPKRGKLSRAVGAHASLQRNSSGPPSNQSPAVRPCPSSAADRTSSAYGGAEHLPLQRGPLHSAQHADSHAAGQRRGHAPVAKPGRQHQLLRQNAILPSAGGLAHGNVLRAAQDPAAGMEALSSAPASSRSLLSGAAAHASCRPSPDIRFANLAGSAAVDHGEAVGKLQATPCLAYFHSRPWRVQTPSSAASSVAVSGTSSSGAKQISEPVHTAIDTAAANKSYHHTADLPSGGSGNGAGRLRPGSGRVQQAAAIPPASSTADLHIAQPSHHTLAGALQQTRHQSTSSYPDMGKAWSLPNPVSTVPAYVPKTDGTGKSSSGITISHALKQHDGRNAAETGSAKSRAPTAWNQQASHSERQPNASTRGLPQNHRADSAKHQAGKQAPWGDFKASLADAQNIRLRPAGRENIPPNCGPASRKSSSDSIASAAGVQSHAAPLDSLVQQLARIQQLQDTRITGPVSAKAGSAKSLADDAETAVPAKGAAGCATDGRSGSCKYASKAPPDRSAALPLHINCRPCPHSSATLPQSGLAAEIGAAGCITRDWRAAAGLLPVDLPVIRQHATPACSLDSTERAAGASSRLASHKPADDKAEDDPRGQRIPTSSSSNSSSSSTRSISKRPIAQQPGRSCHDQFAAASADASAMLQEPVHTVGISPDHSGENTGRHAEGADAFAQRPRDQSVSSASPGADGVSDDSSSQTHVKQPGLSARGISNAEAAPGEASDSTTTLGGPAAACGSLKQAVSGSSLAAAKGVFEGMQAVLDTSILPAEASRQASCTL